MQFALVNGMAVEPSPGLKGICKNCGSEMVAKCGQHKLWHWAHKSRVHCDLWWEAETEWHRAWKNHFPKEWHESILFDPNTGEKHIADVRTEHGLVLEFQHFPMTPAEMKSREDFYKNMVWIVDCCRGELDAAHFNLSLGGRINESPVAHSLHWYGRGKLFHNWIQATKPVLIDFGGGKSLAFGDVRYFHPKRSRWPGGEGVFHPGFHARKSSGENRSLTPYRE